MLKFMTVSLVVIHVITSNTEQNLAIAQEPSTRRQEAKQDQRSTLADGVGRLRFWDIYRRLRAEAERKKVELTAKEEQRVAQILAEATKLDEHYNKLASETNQRLGLLLSLNVKSFIFNAISEAQTLPSDLRTERVRILKQTGHEVEPKVSALLPGIKEALIEDSLTDAHLLDLLVVLRVRLSDLAHVRSLETEQDKVFAYFNSYMLEEIERNAAAGTASPFYSSWRQATVREHRALYDSLGPLSGYGKQWAAQDIREHVVQQQSQDIPIWTTQQLEEFETLAKAVEALRGGPEPQLTFRKPNLTVKRTEVVRVSSLLFDGLRKADEKARGNVPGSRLAKVADNQPLGQSKGSGQSFLEFTESIGRARAERTPPAGFNPLEFINNPSGSQQKKPTGTPLPATPLHSPRQQALAAHMERFLPSISAALSVSR